MARKKNDEERSLPPGPVHTWPNGKYYLGTTDPQWGPPNGFEKIGNAIHLSPGRMEQWSRYLEGCEAIGKLQEGVNTFVFYQNQQLARARRHFWDCVHRDIGVDFGASGVEWQMIDGRLTWKEKKPEDPTGDKK